VRNVEGIGALNRQKMRRAEALVRELLTPIDGFLEEFLARGLVFSLRGMIKVEEEE
jgi:hypothetical protein